MAVLVHQDGPRSHVGHSQADASQYDERSEDDLDGEDAEWDGDDEHQGDGDHGDDDQRRFVEVPEEVAPAPTGA